MLRAALTSRSWTAPQSLHSHSLIPRPAIPFGLEGARVPHSEQVWVLIRSETSRYRPPCVSALYRSEEHTSELQSLMRISYAVFCLKKQTKHTITTQQYTSHTKHTTYENT